ncbi:MAG: peptide deformylase [Bacteriovoracaceae bacterium]|nr:peptide deformylase [Bacteriovoracaceae bacterium]
MYEERTKVFKGVIMAVRPICRMGNPILRQTAAQLSPEEILSKEMKILIQDMKESMDHYGGIGIAAPQIGVSKQVCIIQLEEDNERYKIESQFPFSVFINPVIKVLDKKTQGFWEGCLSVPGMRGYVERPKKIQVDYLNEKGEEKSLVAEDFLAIVIQHELDHLFGKLYIDRIEDVSKLSFNEEFEEYIVPTLSEDEG